VDFLVLPILLDWVKGKVFVHQSTALEELLQVDDEVLCWGFAL
jgi:hypothetical protein